MIRNYFLIAIRNLWRNRVITVINLTGMAIGFAIFLSFWTWTRFDLSFDKFHEDVDRMHILNIRLNMEGSEYTSERTGGIFGSALPENFPQIVDQCRVTEALEFELGIVSEGDSTDLPMKYFSEPEVIAVDSTFLTYFSFGLLRGDVKQIFSQQDHLVITESLAERLFGDEDPMGRSIRMGEGGFFRVVGIMEDPPEVCTTALEILPSRDGPESVVKDANGELFVEEATREEKSVDEPDARLVDGIMPVFFAAPVLLNTPDADDLDKYAEEAGILTITALEAFSGRLAAPFPEGSFFR